ncbi:MAG: MotA/TolQ/ExbB proton channel family protein [Colwellia sp.]|nr:MotA/TolQ/ExbB proton channel family protein [Colwellia sp.]
MMMLSEMMQTIIEFLDTGGQVLTVIAGVVCLMWLLIFERIGFIFISYRVIKRQLKLTWQERTEQQSWHAEQIRLALISRGHAKLMNNLPLIQSLVVLCPLLGLLGTVTGMIQVFDVMAVSGSGDARSMASGVSRATIPTMAGMVGSLSGVFASTWLQRKAKRETQLLEESMPIVH